MASVPIIDLRAHESPDPGERRAMAAALRDGMLEHGFVRVRGHGVDRELVARVHELFARFFAADEETKLACSGVEAGQRGYTPFGVEHARDQPLADLKEFFHVGQEDPPAGAAGYLPNVWPETIPELRPACLDLYRSLEAAARALLQAIAISFSLPPAVFASMLEHGNSILRGLHYPPLQVGADPRAVRAAPHEDINLITLLCGATAAGLEILTRNGDWLAIEAHPDEIVADAGDMLARATNDAIPSTTHRVVTPPGMEASHRYALPFFAHPRPECDLSVLPEFIDRGEAPKYPPISAGQFLRQRLREIGLIER